MKADRTIAALLLQIGLDRRIGKAFFLISPAAKFATHHMKQVTRERAFKAARYDEIVYDGSLICFK